MAPETPHAALSRYVHARAQVRPGSERGRVVAIARSFSTPAIREWLKLHGTRLFVPKTRRRVRRILGSETIRLNLGSGRRRIPGWTNLDLLAMGADLVWDLRRGVPFPDESVSSIFLEHVIEHFRIDECMNLLGECHRALRPGGIIRVGVPDFGRYIESYLGDGSFIESVRPGRPTRMIALNEAAHNHGHRSVWDAETLERALEAAGFDEIRARPFGETGVRPSPDSPNREAETLYVEAIRSN